MGLIGDRVSPRAEDGCGGGRGGREGETDGEEKGAPRVKPLLFITSLLSDTPSPLLYSHGSYRSTLQQC